jgi:hypothetical protein
MVRGRVWSDFDKQEYASFSSDLRCFVGGRTMECRQWCGYECVVNKYLKLCVE